MRFTVLAVFCALFSLTASNATAQDPVALAQAYGKDADIHSLDLSPSGTKLAYVMNRDGDRYLVVSDLDTFKSLYSIKIVDYFVSSLSWADEETIIMTAVISKTGEAVFEGRSGAVHYAIHLKKERIVPLLNGKKGQTRQYAMGGIDGRDETGQFVFMPAWTMDNAGIREYDLYKVSLSHGKGVKQANAGPHTYDYIVTPKGDVVARANHDDVSNRLFFEVPGNTLEWRTVYEERNKLPSCGLSAITQDYKKIVMSCDADSRMREGYRLIDIETGDISDPMTTPSGKRVDWVYRGPNKVLFAARHYGLTPEFEFYDADLQKAYTELLPKLQGTSLYLMSWNVTETSKRLIFRLDAGIGGSGKYIMLDALTGKITPIVSKYKSSTDIQVGRVHTIEYAAQDGLPIEGVLTWPPQADTSKPLPLVVLPHGGPASHDTVTYDYMAQYIARLGYLVLQPNFRGSTGYGDAFMRAGDGEWGRKMQTDLSDGITALANRGWADPDRVCIAGYSYGGYAALAGIAFQPDTYKCAIAGMGISDLNVMMNYERDTTRKYSWVVDYWERVIANNESNRARLTEASPINAIDQIKAPLLMIHGDKDTIVDIEQSELMLKAMKAAGKDARLVVMKDARHSFAHEHHRIQALEEMGKFLTEHLPPE